MNVIETAVHVQERIELAARRRVKPICSNYENCGSITREDNSYASRRPALWQGIIQYICFIRRVPRFIWWDVSANTPLYQNKRRKLDSHRLYELQQQLQQLLWWGGYLYIRSLWASILNTTFRIHFSAFSTQRCLFAAMVQDTSSCEKKQGYCRGFVLSNIGKSCDFSKK